MGKGGYTGGSTIVGPEGWGTFDPAEDREGQRLKAFRKSKPARPATVPKTRAEIAKKEAKAAAQAQRDAEQRARAAAKAAEKDLNRRADEARKFLNAQSRDANPALTAAIDRAAKKSVAKPRKPKKVGKVRLAERAARKAAAAAAAKVVVEHRKSRAKQVEQAKATAKKADASIAIGPPGSGIGVPTLEMEGESFRILKLVVRRKSEQE